MPMTKNFLVYLREYEEHGTRWLKFYVLVQFWLMILCVLGSMALFLVRSAQIIQADEVSLRLGTMALMGLAIFLDIFLLIYLGFTQYAVLLLAKGADKLHAFYLWLLTGIMGYNAPLLLGGYTDVISFLAMALGAAGVITLLWTLPNRKYFRKREALFVHEFTRPAPAAAPVVPRPAQPKAPRPPKARKKLKKAAAHEETRPPLSEDKQIKYQYAPNTFVGSLDMLQKLYEKGMINKEEYEQKKKEQEEKSRKKYEE